MLKCVSDLYRKVCQIDDWYWSEDNITALCTSSCIDDSSTWVGNVADVCIGQTYNAGGKLVKMDSVTFRYVEGITMACLKSEYVFECPFTNHPKEPIIKLDGIFEQRFASYLHQRPGSQRRKPCRRRYRQSQPNHTDRP